MNSLQKFQTRAVEGLELGQITWWIVCWPNIEHEGQHPKKITRKSRNSCRLNSGGVGAHGQLSGSLNGLSPQYKRSKNNFWVTSIALTLVPLCIELLELSAQFFEGSPGTLNHISIPIFFVQSYSTKSYLMITLYYYSLFFLVRFVWYGRVVQPADWKKMIKALWPTVLLLVRI